MDPLHLLIAINRAQLSGYPHFAAALLALYRREFMAACPAQRGAFSPCARPGALGAGAGKAGAFATVTGRDFGRSIAWARATPSALTLHLQAARARLAPPSPCSP